MLLRYFRHQARAFSFLGDQPQALQGRLAVHYLPTYSPDDNPIERFWEDFHAEVTRNHQCPTMDDLVVASDEYLYFQKAVARRILDLAVAKFQAPMTSTMLFNALT